MQSSLMQSSLSGAGAAIALTSLLAGSAVAQDVETFDAPTGVGHLFTAAGADITPAGLAVGQEAAQVKRNMFKNTVEVPENHGLVESIGAGTTAALELE